MELSCIGIGRLVQLFVLSTITVGALIGQSSSQHFPLIESHIGRAVVDNEGSSVIAGVGLWKYIGINEFHNKRISKIGLSFPARLAITSPNEEVLSNYDYSLSISTMFRFAIQSRPANEILWFFIGVGPEMRVIWEGDDQAYGMPLVQQEVGFTIRKDESLIFENMEFGFSTSFPVRKKEWDQHLHFASFFIRLSITR